MHTTRLLLLLLQFGVAVGVRCACTSCKDDREICETDKTGRCFARWTLQGQGTGAGDQNYTVELGCTSRGSDICTKRPAAGRQEFNQCCKSPNFCNRQETSVVVPVTRKSTLLVPTARPPGLLRCSCSTCGGKETCTVDTRKGGKCLVDMYRSDGQVLVNLGCVSQSKFHCDNSQCCSDRDLCNLHLLNRMTPPPDAPTVINMFPKTTTATIFMCYCNSCPRQSCQTSSYCVAAAASVGHHVEYGCVDSNSSILMHMCRNNMPYVYCCKGDNCNKNKHPTELPSPSGTTEQSVDRITTQPQPENCKLSHGSVDELNDSEYIVILVCVTVPSFFIFLALTAIFCYTLKKYHKQSRAQMIARGTSVMARNCQSVSKLSNGKLYSGSPKD